MTLSAFPPKVAVAPGTKVKPETVTWNVPVLMLVGSSEEITGTGFQMARDVAAKMVGFEVRVAEMVIGPEGISDGAV